MYPVAFHPLHAIAPQHKTSLAMENTPGLRDEEDARSQKYQRSKTRANVARSIVRDRFEIRRGDECCAKETERSDDNPDASKQVRASGKGDRLAFYWLRQSHGSSLPHTPPAARLLDLRRRHRLSLQLRNSVAELRGPFEFQVGGSRQHLRVQFFEIF